MSPNLELMRHGKFLSWNPNPQRFSPSNLNPKISRFLHMTKSRVRGAPYASWHLRSAVPSACNLLHS
ncbi:hypothetical protein CEK26_009732 [Fusarium fujikuroi]|nr:hypothetical protein CEK27_009753 [Fusarium fujikuroi]QGI83023.1 hypothetical protein CEK25_009752 [Fusarium fujikuroi]QGI96663.1 hypothetical protein CEK26_009732 [Fusarium fujikuroi]